MARKPENIPGYDRLSPRAKLILTGQSVYDRPLNQRGTVTPNISQKPPTPRPPTPPKPKAPIGEFKLNMSQIRDKIGNLSLTNQYLVNLPIGKDILDYIKEYYQPEFDNYSIKEFGPNLGFYCAEATLPVSSYATAEVKDNILGVTQEFAHTRLYTDLDLTFYVDSNYDVLRYFELWLDFISAGEKKFQNSQSGNAFLPTYFRRFKYPDQYKTSQMSIVKFERDYEDSLSYNFMNAFPKGLTSIPVSYGSADLLKVTVTFNYDRYVVIRKKLSQF